MSNIVTLNGQEIQLMKVGINNQLNGKQKKLLSTLHDCLKQNTPLNWEIMVKLYCEVNNYPKDERDNYYNREIGKWQYRIVLSDPLKNFKNKDDKWTYHFKPKIRQWFANNIGSMVLKGSILALPVIEID
jgi:hypothetical protein